MTLVPAYARMPVRFVRGRGSRLWDDEGIEYLDLQTGLAVNSVGHCHPAVVEAITEQAAELIHVGNVFHTNPGEELARRLVASSLGGALHYANSGTEANEAAIKMARKAKPGGEIVSVHNAFHGRTYGSLSATPQESKQAPFAPLVPGFVAVEPTVDALTAAIGDQTAAVILEPVQGEGGVWPLGSDVLRAARAACDRHGAALIFDEVQVGLGRTGTLWAHQHDGVVPDLMTIAKALGGGLPIGAVVTNERFAAGFEPGDHGSTFAGGPVQCAAGLAVLDIVSDETVLAQVRENGVEAAARLSEHPAVTGVRGRGHMLGVELDPRLDARAAVRLALAEERLLLNAPRPTTIRLLPALTIEPTELDDALARLMRVLDRL
ncbi:MAG: acetylornithine/succinylornithine family transaminase [Baekduia sp.]